MKKVFTLLFLIIASFRSEAQVTSLSETFNIYCAVLGENYPTNWSEYDNYSNPVISWTCAPDQGRGATATTTSPGILCTNYDGVNNYVDTSWLFTPQLNLSWVTGNIYLQFDSKYIIEGGRMSLLVSNTYEAGWAPDTALATHTWYDATSSITPVLGNVGTSDWITYVVDLTAFKSSPLYVAFRFTGSSLGASTWIIDNVYTTQTPTGIPIVTKSTLPLTVIGNSTSDQIILSYNVPYAAVYQLVIYDMIGNIVYKGSVNAQPGEASQTISGLGLNDGMYLVKMSDGAVYNTAKIMIR